MRCSSATTARVRHWRRDKPIPQTQGTPQLPAGEPGFCLIADAGGQPMPGGPLRAERCGVGHAHLDRSDTTACELGAVDVVLV
jgi:hypothetical protein